MFFKKLASLCVGLAFAFTAATANAGNVQLKTAWMDEHESFIMWYAIEKGWDKEEGLEVEMQLFSSGMDIINAFPGGSWVFAGEGNVPAIMGALRYPDIEVLLVGNDESFTNCVMVRGDSPIAKVKGFNPKYPNVLGNPETVKGKTFLCTTVSSAHYALSSWLAALGLKDTDVTIKNMDQAQALAAYQKGIGDGVALWAPHMYKGEELGWKIAGTVKDCGKTLPIVLVADKKFTTKNPELTSKFLKVYLRALNMVKNEDPKSLVKEYQRFFLDFCGKEYSADTALKDLQTHPVYNLAEQKAMFDASKGKSTVQTWQGDIATFFSTVGKIKKEELPKVVDGKFTTGKYLDGIKEIKPYK